MFRDLIFSGSTAVSYLPHCLYLLRTTTDIIPYFVVERKLHIEMRHHMHESCCSRRPARGRLIGDENGADSTENPLGKATSSFRRHQYQSYLPHRLTPMSAYCQGNIVQSLVPSTASRKLPTQARRNSSRWQHSLRSSVCHSKSRS